MSFSILRIGARRALGIVEKTNCYSSLGCSKIYNQQINHAHTQGNQSHVKMGAAQAAKGYSKHAGQLKRNEKAYAQSESGSESDEHIPKNHRGESEFWRRKMRTVHSLLDVNKDGVISFDDFKLLTEKFVNLGHLTAHQADDFREAIKELWEHTWGEITPYNLVTAEQYLEDMHHIMNDKTLRKKVHDFLPYLFNAVDKNKQGEITIEEFKIFFECLGIHGHHAYVSFELIDTNGDGKLNLQEFMEHGRAYFVTENDKCVSKAFWGPLLD